MSISEIFIRRRVGTGLLAMGIILLGAIAYMALPVASLPQVDFPTIQISASLPGASAETMATTVATPLETSLSIVSGVTQMTSSSSSGRGWPWGPWPNGTRPVRDACPLGSSIWQHVLSFAALAFCNRRQATHAPKRLIAGR